MSRKSIQTDGAAVIGPYSQAVDSNGFLFLSGQTPADPVTGRLVGQDIGEQTIVCLENLRRVLAAAGLSEADVVNVQVYLVDMNDFSEMNRVYSNFFSKPFPARTTIGVASLPLGARVEIGMLARTKNSSTQP